MQNMPQTTLSKLIELLSGGTDYEAVIKCARFLQKSMEMLGQECSEAALLDLSRRFVERGIMVDGDLSVLREGSDLQGQYNGAMRQPAGAL